MQPEVVQPAGTEGEEREADRAVDPDPAGAESEPTHTGPELTGFEREEVAVRAGLMEEGGVLKRSLALLKVETVIDDKVQPIGWVTKKEAAAIRRVLLGMEKE